MIIAQRYKKNLRMLSNSRNNSNNKDYKYILMYI